MNNIEKPIQIQLLLKLNFCRLVRYRLPMLNSNTTLVKVKYNQQLASGQLPQFKYNSC